MPQIVPGSFLKNAMIDRICRVALRISSIMFDAATIDRDRSMARDQFGKKAQT